MRKDRPAFHRLRILGGLQTLKEQASRAELGQARSAHYKARDELDFAQQALTGKIAEVDSLMAADSLDFDRWRIGIAMLGDLATRQDAASDLVRLRRDAEDVARTDWHRQNTIVRNLRETSRQIMRRLADKADEAIAAEATDLLLARSAGKSG
jgi:hypothetical protein